MESLLQIPAIGDGRVHKIKSISKGKRKPNYGGGCDLSLRAPQFQKKWKSTRGHPHLPGAVSGKRWNINWLVGGLLGVEG